MKKMIFGLYWKKIIMLFFIVFLFFCFDRKIGAEILKEEKLQPIHTYYRVVVHYKVKIGLSIARIYTNLKIIFYTPEIMCDHNRQEVNLLGAYNDAELKYKVADFIEIRKTTGYDQQGEWIEQIEVVDSFGKLASGCNW